MRRAKFLERCWIIAALIPLAGPVALSAPPGSTMAVGGNLSIGEGVKLRVFTDLFRQSGDWFTRGVDSNEFSSNEAARIPRDTNGWPLRVPFDAGDGLPPQLVFTDLWPRGHGVYHLVARGKGHIRMCAPDRLLDPSTPFQREIEFTIPGGTTTLDVTLHSDATENPMFLYIVESDPADPIRDVHFYAPGFTSDDGPAGPFIPEYIESLRSFRALRLMDFGHANNNPVVHWADRPGTNYYSQLTERGVAIEFIIDLANRAGLPPWFCVPHLADDDYVRRFARMIHENLRPDLKIFIEYSNETWNFTFGQAGYAWNVAGPAAGINGDEFVARRSAQIWAIFEEEFGLDRDRLVKVMAGQAASTAVAERRLNGLRDPAVNPLGIQADALAIAPYFGGGVADQIAADGKVDSATIDDILDGAAKILRGDVIAWTQAHQALAALNHLWLVDYEAGQHLVAVVGTNVNNPVLTRKLIEANGSTRMGALYTEYLDEQQRDGVGLCNLYNHIFTPDGHGSWGLLTSLDQPTSESAKWSAFVAWLAAHPAPNVPPRANAGPDQFVLADSGGSGSVITLDATASRDLDGRIVNVQWHEGATLLGAGSSLTARLPLGRHVITATTLDSNRASADDALLVTVAPASAGQSLLTADFHGTDPALHLPWKKVHQLGGHTVYSGFRKGPGVRTVAGTDQLEFWVLGTDNGEIVSLATAVSQGDYLSFTVTAEPPFELDLRGAPCHLHWLRAGLHSPRQFAVMTSIGGFGVGKEIFASVSNDEIDREDFFNLPFDGFDHVRQTVEFRLYAFGERYANKEAGIVEFSLGGGAVGPRLQITHRVGEIELRWSESPARLASASSLDPSPVWQPVAGTPQFADGERFIIVPITGTQQFFTLIPEL